MLVIAHRGASGYKPENTLSAIEYALTLGIRAIELDVHCVEGVLYVFHDRRLDYKSNGSGLIHLKTEAELSQLTILGEAIPTLWQVLQLIDGRAMVNIELKGIDTLQPLIDNYPWYLQELGYSPQQLLISSFNHRYLAQLRLALPDVHIGLLLGGIPLELDASIAAIAPHSLHLDINFISKQLFAEAKQQQLNVYVYTVDHQDDIDALALLGVDGIFCNYPDKAVARLTEMGVKTPMRWFD